MSNHTPGPWRIEDHDEQGEPYENGVRIDADEGPVAFDVIDCSAPLIAAAPDLLEAMKELIDQLEGIGIPDWHGAEGLSLDQARAAINKAEGNN
jgi:hypothetical protein